MAGFDEKQARRCSALATTFIDFLDDLDEDSGEQDTFIFFARFFEELLRTEAFEIGSLSKAIQLAAELSQSAFPLSKPLREKSVGTIFSEFFPSRDPNVVAFDRPSVGRLPHDISNMSAKEKAKEAAIVFVERNGSIPFSGRQLNEILRESDASIGNITKATEALSDSEPRFLKLVDANEREKRFTLTDAGESRLLQKTGKGPQRVVGSIS
ncbi:MAG: hypothetical protein AAF236_02605 [Verrucomicrobiota bacterium]